MEAATAPTSICCWEAKTWCRIVGVAQALSGLCGIAFGIYALAAIREPGGLYYAEDEEGANDVLPIQMVWLIAAFVFAFASGLAVTMGSLLYTATIQGDRSLLGVWIGSAVFLNLVFIAEAVTMILTMEDLLLFLVALPAGMVLITVFAIYVVAVFRIGIQVKVEDKN